MIEKSLELLTQIEENVSTCCAITMEPDKVLVLIDELRKILESKKYYMYTTTTTFGNYQINYIIIKKSPNE
jgi:hypothetical protein